MHSKQSGLLLSHMIVIVAITAIVFLSDLWLESVVHNPYFRVLILCMLAALLYYFLASSIIEPFLQTDAKLKEMIDHTLHELNTPIATIEANLTLLKRSIKAEKNQKRLSRIGEATKHLTQLYESIEYNIKENIEHIERQRFDLHTCIEESIERFSDLNKDVSITDTTVPLHLYTDKNGFSRMIDNLLSNAIKYNKPHGYVKFYMRGNKLFIEDSGIGIDTRNLFIVYEKTFQENPSTKGYGLGLSIVKNFCDKHKITIKIDTQKDVGTTFMLDLSGVVHQ